MERNSIFRIQSMLCIQNHIKRPYWYHKLQTKACKNGTLEKHQKQRCSKYFSLIRREQSGWAGSTWKRCKSFIAEHLGGAGGAEEKAWERWQGCFLWWASVESLSLSRVLANIPSWLSKVGHAHFLHLFLWSWADGDVWDLQGSWSLGVTLVRCLLF